MCPWIFKYEQNNNVASPLFLVMRNLVLHDERVCLTFISTLSNNKLVCPVRQPGWNRQVMAHADVSILDACTKARLTLAEISVTISRQFRSLVTFRPSSQ